MGFTIQLLFQSGGRVETFPDLCPGAKRRQTPQPASVAINLSFSLTRGAYSSYCAPMRLLSSWSETKPIERRYAFFAAVCMACCSLTSCSVRSSRSAACG